MAIAENSTARNTVYVDRQTSPAKISFSDSFNTAVPFIDRHIDEGRGDKTAIRTDAGVEVSYAQLALNVNRCGNTLRSLGAGHGDRVLLIVKDCPAFFYLFWGAIKAGVVPVPLNTLLRAPEYQFFVEDSATTGIVYSPDYAAELEPALNQSHHKPRFTCMTEGRRGLSELMEAASPELAPAAATPEADCFWLYSSGSTGRPKGAIHRQRDITVTCVRYAEGVLGITEDDVCFSAAKLFFAYGLGNAMTFPLWAGATCILCAKPPTPEVTFDMIQRFRPTIYYGVPTLYAAQLRAMESVSCDPSSLRTCISAAEPLPADILRRWHDRIGLPILDGIGSTELLHIFISNAPEGFRPASSGRIVPGYEARIVDEDGNEVAAGRPGRLMIKGQSAARCYWHDPDRTAATMQGEWVNTGDTYVVDDDGWFTYCGRTDDMLKVGGIWCSPIEIEARLIEHPKVLEAAVVGWLDEDSLTKPAAFVVLNDPRDAGPVLEKELVDDCKSGLARYKYPRWIHFVEELPKTATGKIQRFKLRSRQKTAK